MSRAKKVKIETYKGTNIYFNKDSSKLCFEFEGREYERVNYLFEAREIIDEPRWEECELEGYFIDGYIDRYIGLVKATRKDIKSGRPDWKFKGQYDLEYKRSTLASEKETKVYLKNKYNDEIYKKWQEQRNVYIDELNKLNKITLELK